MELQQYHQLPDKNSCNISQDIWNFKWYFKTFIYQTIVCGTFNVVLRNPGWETLHYVTGKVHKVYRFRNCFSSFRHPKL